MKYKNGDIVRMKKCHEYADWFEEFVKKHNYILTIVGESNILKDRIAYIIKELKEERPNGQHWIQEKYIEGFYSSPKVEIFEPVYSRFEILDL